MCQSQQLRHRVTHLVLLRQTLHGLMGPVLCPLSSVLHLVLVLPSPKVDIVTGTPGRLDDLISTGHLDLSNVRE